MKYNLNGLNLNKRAIFEGSIENMRVTEWKKEYYLTLSVIIEEQPAKNVIQELEELQKELLEIIGVEKNKTNNGFHIYTKNEFHFSLVNFLTYNYRSTNETETSAFLRFKNNIQVSSLVKKLGEKIEDLVMLYKIKPDFYNAKVGIIYAGDGSVAVQIFLGESLVKFCDHIAIMARNSGFPDSEAKIHPKGDRNKNRCVLNILKILKSEKNFIKDKDNFDRIVKKIIEKNNIYLKKLINEELLNLRLKKLSLDISDPYLSRRENKYFLVKEFLI